MPAYGPAAPVSDKLSPMRASLASVLAVERGVVCFVGAGGKKTLMFHLAAGHDGRVGITATAHIEHFPRRLAARVLVDNGPDLIERLAAERGPEAARCVAFAKPCEIRGRYAGLSDDELQQAAHNAGFDLIVVKADGARSRLIKAPAAHEPALPAHRDLVVPVVSARVLGKALTEKVAHRPAIVAEVTGAEMGATLNSHHLARLLSSPAGSLKNTGETRVVPVINMVDTPLLERQARAAAEEALSLTDRYDRVVLTAMKREIPYIDTVFRDDK
jgi:probable selenium-dependent hydroxylase accessory protein YqeC